MEYKVEYKKYDRIFEFTWGGGVHETILYWYTITLEHMGPIHYEGAVAYGRFTRKYNFP